MSEWWTYGLSDFLMFSPEAYWRLVARHNAAWWPAQALGLAAGGGLLALALSGAATATRAALLLLALAWAWVGWAFHAQRYTEIFLGARWLAAACAVQAVLLVAAALLRMDGAPRGGRRAGMALLLAALLYPLLAPLTGHGWQAAEVFGWMPEPTALGTMGVLLAWPTMPSWRRVLLAVIPLLSLLLGAATRWLLA